MVGWLPELPAPSPPQAPVTKTQMGAHSGPQPEGVTQGFSGQHSVKYMFH